MADLLLFCTQGYYDCDRIERPAATGGGIIKEIFWWLSKDDWRIRHSPAGLFGRRILILRRDFLDAV